MSPQDDFISILLSYKNKIWPVIEDYLKKSTIFPQFCAIDPKYQDTLDFHLKLISDYPQRKGKYLRPSLLSLTAQSLGVPMEKILPVAAAMQLSEEWILCHDDIEDNSLERRGQPTLHRLYGKELAINAGDSLQLIMWKIIADAGNPKITNEFFSLLNRTAFGQTIDIKWNQSNLLNLSDEDIFLILESKTCYYTISGPMRLGAILADASPDQLDQIYQFGLYLGRSFQIVDDLLDLTSDFSGLKKQQFNDIYEGKRTIMLCHLWRSASPADQKIIFEIMQKTRDQKTAAEVAAIISLMNQYGSLDYGRKLAADFGSRAKKIFNEDLQFLNIEPFRSQISAGIDFIVNRDH